MVRRILIGTLKQARRLVVAVVGFTVVLIGIIMFFTPGPAIVVIPVGLGILATEFLWARRLLKQFKEKAAQMANKANWKSSRSKKEVEDPVPSNQEKGPTG